jgi:hypothetical protein
VSTRQVGARSGAEGGIVGVAYNGEHHFRPLPRRTPTPTYPLPTSADALRKEKRTAAERNAAGAARAKKTRDARKEALTPPGTTTRPRGRAPLDTHGREKVWSALDGSWITTTEATRRVLWNYRSPVTDGADGEADAPALMRDGGAPATLGVSYVATSPQHVETSSADNEMSFLIASMREVDIINRQAVDRSWSDNDDADESASNATEEEMLGGFDELDAILGEEPSVCPPAWSQQQEPSLGASPLPPLQLLQPSPSSSSSPPPEPTPPPHPPPLIPPPPPPPEPPQPPEAQPLPPQPHPCQQPPSTPAPRDHVNAPYYDAEFVRKTGAQEDDDTHDGTCDVCAGPCDASACKACEACEACEVRCCTGCAVPFPEESVHRCSPCATGAGDEAEAEARAAAEGRGMPTVPAV